VLFHYALTESLPLYFTCTDYNSSVLQLVTLPNLLLTYASTVPEHALPFSQEQPNPLYNLSSSSKGELDITPALLSSFTTALANADIHLALVSGSWSPMQPFLSLIPTDLSMNTLALASETIYSPSAMESFAQALVGVLGTVRLGKAIVAAKRVYFGVGGGTDQFKRICAELGAVVADVENYEADLGAGGVRRCLLEVQMM
jgi:protein-histidine N-methyltransferase